MNPFKGVCLPKSKKAEASLSGRRGGAELMKAPIGGGGARGVGEVGGEDETRP